MKNDSTPSLEDRTVAAIGAPALAALREAGLSIVDTEELAAYQAETEMQVERLRALVRAATTAAETRAILFDTFISDDTAEKAIRFVLCDPSGDEEAMCLRIVKALGFEPNGAKYTGIDSPPARV